MSPDYRVGPSGATGTDADPAAEGDVPWSDEPERRESIVSGDLHGARLDKAVVAFVPEFSRSHLQTLIEGGHVCVEDRPVTTASRKVLAGQRIAVELVPTPQSQAFRPEPVPRPAVFAAEH